MYKKNRVGFANYIKQYIAEQNENYHTNKESLHTQQQNEHQLDIFNKTYKLMFHQKIISAFLNYQTPYRGLLVYHGVGTGKTFTAISLIQNLERYKRIYILTKASLIQSFIQEIILFNNTYEKKWAKKNDKYLDDSYSDTYKLEYVSYKSLSIEDKNKLYQQEYQKIYSKYNFLAHNGLRKKKVNTLNFDNSLCIIDEAHNFIQTSIGQDKIGALLYNRLLVSKNSKLLLLSGTPVLNNPLELGYTINLIQGFVKLYIVNYSFELMKYLQQSIYVDYYEQNIVNLEKKIAFVLNPEGFVNQKNQQNFLQKIDNQKSLTHEQILKDIKHKFKLSEKEIIQENRTPFPFDQLQFIYEYGGVQEGGLQNIDRIKRRVLGNVSYFRIKSQFDELFPEVKKIKFIYLYMTQSQYNIYNNVRHMEKLTETYRKPDIENDKNMGLYKVFSRGVCNFVFPKEIKRIYPSELRQLSQEDQYIPRMEKAMKQLTLHSDNYLCMSSLQQLSPKYYNIIKFLKDPDNVGSNLCFSSFLRFEGTQIFQLALQENGFSKLCFKKNSQTNQIELNMKQQDLGKPLFIEFFPEDPFISIYLDIFNNNFEKLHYNVQQQFYDFYHKSIIQKRGKYTQNLFGDIVKLLIIRKSGAEGLSLKNVRHVHIIEPYWNNILIDQIIGRATRQFSHVDLPPSMRNVQAYMYLIKFTEQQIKKNTMLESLDRGLTTDQALLDIANRKQQITDQLLQILQECSIDCSFQQNKHQKCYQFPDSFSNSKLTYELDAEKNIQNYKILNIYLTLIRVGPNKIKLYLNKNTGEVYDFDTQIKIGNLVQQKIFITNINFISQKLKIQNKDINDYKIDNIYIINIKTNQKYKIIDFIYGFGEQY